jgi:hypothetical protein
MMGGDAADPMIADAYAFGAQDFDLNTALQYMLKGANDTTSAWGQGVYSPRESYISQPEWGDYLRQGYVRSGTDAPFGTALTEEFSLADFAISQFAPAAGDPSIQSTYLARGQNWQNVFDPGSGYVQPRGPGALPLTSDPSTQTEGMEEGDAAQYTWMVPQNFAGLFAALGGERAAASRLDQFFTQLNAGSTAPYDWQGNEVTLDSPWAYDYLGQPWKTQKTVRDIITQLYSPTPGGEPGNDDLGAMSSWYVWAALGIYPETPGTGTLALGSPLFPTAVIHLANGKDITINAPNAAAGAPYVQGLQINGQDWPKNYLSPGQYNHGVTLDYDLATTPSTSRGTGPEADPPSYTSGEAPAIGFTSPWGAAVVSPGQSQTVHVGAQSEVQQPQTLTWSATALPGIQLTPSTGTLTLNPGAQATQPATISAPAGTPNGTYPVHITFTGNAGRQVSSTDVEVQVQPPVGTANVCTTLDTTNTSNGLTLVDWGDGATAPVQVAGLPGRVMVKGTDANDVRYMYFNVDDKVAYNGTFQAVFTITYLDQGTGSFSLQYDSNNPSGAHSGAYTNAGSVKRTGTGTWKTATFTVNDAKFADRENAGADFRLASGGSGDAYAVTVHSAAVKVTGPGVLPSDQCSGS